MTEDNTNHGSTRLSGWLSTLLFFGAVALVVVAVALFYPSGPAVVAAAEETTTTTVAPDEVDVALPATPGSDEPVADAAEIILPSVVLIRTGTGLGSGVIYDADGLIMTAAHVVQDHDTVQIRLADGEQMTGTVLGTAPVADIAVIQVDQTGLPAATFSTEGLRVGQMAIAVGSPWGLASTVTSGIISAVNQTNCSINTCSSMVQTDAAINPGNSGGPLVNRAGEVVGINVSIFTTSGANDGVGFAVPADTALTYANAIVSGEPIETAFFGVRGENVDTEGQAGARITEVVADSSAEKSGMKVDDVVVGLDGVPIFTWPDLVAQVRAHQPGETVKIIVLRGDEELTLDVTFGVRTEEVS